MGMIDSSPVLLFTDRNEAEEMTKAKTMKKAMRIIVSTFFIT